MALELGDRDIFNLRVDVATEEDVGLRIEGFVSDVVPRHPSLAGALDVASPEEIEGDEIESSRRRLRSLGSVPTERAELIDASVRLPT